MAFNRYDVLFDKTIRYFQLSEYWYSPTRFSLEYKDTIYQVKEIPLWTRMILQSSYDLFELFAPFFIIAVSLKCSDGSVA